MTDINFMQAGNACCGICGMEGMHKKEHECTQEEAHDTAPGYCCACDYDIACFKHETKLAQEYGKKKGHTAERTRILSLIQEMIIVPVEIPHGSPYISGVNATLTTLKDKIEKE